MITATNMGHQTWGGEIITSEFKENKGVKQEKPTSEQEFVDHHFTEHYCRKEVLKFIAKKGMTEGHPKFMKEFVDGVFH